MFENNDDWDIDEDYFEDFNNDEFVKDSLNEKKEETQPESLPQTVPVPKQLEGDCSVEDNLQNKVSCSKEVSQKNAILDIFKSNDEVQEDLKGDDSFLQPSNDSPEKLFTSTPQELSQKNLVLNIFQKPDFSCNNQKSDLSAIKPALKSTEESTDCQNKFKRKKCVAFLEQVTESKSLKRICVAGKDASVEDQSNDSSNKQSPTVLSETLEKNIPNNNENYRKQMLLNVLKSPVQKKVIAPSVKKTVVRKFPGPAGLLDDDNLTQPDTISISTVSKNESKSKKYSDICSQNTKNLFTTGAWQLMMDDLPADFQLQDIASVKENALEYSQKYIKVPYLAGIIQYIDYKPNDPHVILKDFSGKIDARIHHSICKLYPSALGTNVVILVKDVGVIVTSKKYVCIIISPKNLVSIYSDDARLVETPLLNVILDNNENYGLSTQLSESS